MNPCYVISVKAPSDVVEGIADIVYDMCKKAKSEGEIELVRDVIAKEWRPGAPEYKRGFDYIKEITDVLDSLGKEAAAIERADNDGR